MAQQAGLDLTRVNGSGPHGRIVKADIDAALARGVPGAPSRCKACARGAAGRGPAGLHGSAAQHGAQGDRPPTGRVEARGAAFLFDARLQHRPAAAARQEINAKREKDKISVNDFVIKASALALKQVPAANASWTESAVRLYQAADVSVAVATPGGLITTDHPQRWDEEPERHLGRDEGPGGARAGE
jgi:pyruvate dehydrogenase E2 component (dihydrolipoamide acetyltransferase)